MKISSTKTYSTTPPPMLRKLNDAGRRLGGVLTWLSLALFLVVASPAQSEDLEAVAFAEDVSQEIVEILEDPANNQNQKLEKIAALLDETVDFDLVGKMVLGPHWRAASEDQREEYLSLFRAHVLANISQQLSFYSGQEFEILGAQTLNARDTMVQTRVEAPSGKVYRIDWRVRHDGDEFAVIDVIGEGISLVVSQRSEVGETVNRRGMDGLLAAMRDRLGESIIPN